MLAKCLRQINHHSLVHFSVDIQGKVYVPTLKCKDTALPCYDKDENSWYDFPGEDEFDGYTTTPSGLQIKDLPVNPDLKELVKTSPSPLVEEVGCVWVLSLCASPAFAF